MKFLHTGDLHLGKIFHEVSLLDDQRHILRQLIQELEKDDYSALLIAGDVYDRSIPPADAVEAFSGFLADVREKFPDLAVLVIPGNHDSAQRLSFAAEILRRQNIHIACTPENAFAPIIVTHKNEKVAFFLLSFLSPRSLKRTENPGTGGETRAQTETPPQAKAGSKPKTPAQEEDLFSRLETEDEAARDAGEEDGALFSQEELAEEACRRFRTVLQSDALKGVPAVLVAHCFAAGGAESSSERVFVGNAEKIPPRLFADFAYVALGHLHRFQKVTDRMYYSGSPLAYAFDEADTEKFFLKVEIGADAAAEVTPLKITPKKNVRRLRGEFAEFFGTDKFLPYAQDYLEIELTDKSVTLNPMQLLRQRFPFLLSVRQNFLRDGAETEDGGKTRTSDTESPADNFERFENYLYPGQTEDELNQKKEIFAQIVGECAESGSADET